MESGLVGTIKELLEAEVTKAPYEMTPHKYHEWRSSNGHKNREENNTIHKSYVEGAITGRLGKLIPGSNKRIAHVPDHVMKHYPDLHKEG